MHTLAQDLRYAIRSFAKTPGFTLVAMLSLALGIGVNSAIFSVTDALLLHSLPYTDADRLVILWNRSPGLNIAEDWFSTAQFFDIRNGHSGFEQVAIAIGANYNLTGDGESERIGTIKVSSNLLPMLGARAELGRLFLPEEDSPGRAATAVLSYGTWARRYGRDPRAIGKSITLNGQTYEVVGVLPASFSLPREVLPTLGVAEDGEIFLPLPLAAAASTVRNHEDYNIVGKLRRGVSLRQAQAGMDALTARLRRTYPQVYPPNGGLTFGIVPLQEQVVGGVRKALLILAVAVGFVLLIACANVVNLVLARTLARRKEIAVRAALGAGRARIVRQLLTESVVLALGGGALGVLIAMAGVRWIHILQPQSVPRLRFIAVNGEVLAFTLLLCLCSAVLFGLAPALRICHADLQDNLKDAGRGSAGAGSVWGRGSYARRTLVVAELAVSLVLLAGAGLLIRSFARLQNVRPGFNAEGLLTLDLTMNGRKYADGPAVLSAYRELWNRLDALPGARASGGVSALPLSEYFSWGPITVEGRTPPAGENFLNCDERVAGGRYFQAMQIPLLRGRFFDERDTASNPRVIIVDQYMAEQLWPGQDPIGKRIRFGGLQSTAPWQTVVGVVGRVKQYALESDGRIALYLPQTQTGTRAMYVVLRTSGNPESLAAAVTKEIRGLDRDLPVYHIRTMTARVAESLAPRRFVMTLLALFAGIALALAMIGIYGVMAYLVSQSTREIGIRLALGATHRAILQMVVGRGIAIALAGVGLGLAGAAASTRALSSFLFGVQATDLPTFAAVSALLAAVALAASYVPARRAARIDPMVSLRSE